MSGDRRRFAREQCLISAHLRVGTKIHEGTLVNVGEDGAFCATHAAVEPGAAVQVRFRHPWNDEPVTAAAVVMRRSRPGDGLGPQAGVALALLDSLSDLEDTTANVSLSDSLPPEAMRNLRDLRKRALSANVERSGGHPTVISGPSPTVSGPHPRPNAVTCTFEATGHAASPGTLRDITPTGFMVATLLPPVAGRLVRVEIDPVAEGVHPARIAGEVLWTSADPDDPRGQGFGLQILHFLSSADERRYLDLLSAQ